MICAPRKMLSVWSVQGGLDANSTWHIWGRAEIHTRELTTWTT